jgi:hypothetical protein
MACRPQAAPARVNHLGDHRIGCIKRRNCMSVSTGVIAYFDILGYQNLLLNNEPEDVADKVISRLTSLNATVTAEIKSKFPRLFENKKIIPILDAIQWLVFSDTILFTNSFDPEEEKKDTVLRWFVILLYCAHVQAYMFNNGIPIRGAITYGKYMVKDLCFAGRPIIEVYQLANRLELSAVVATAEMEDEMAKIAAVTVKTFSGADIADIYLERYLVPLKDNQSQHYRTINYYDVAGLGDKDLRQETLNMFWGHKKDISQSDLVKVLNTEQHLRYLKRRITPAK